MQDDQRLINFRPICVAAAFFAVGIACAYFVEYDIVKFIICLTALVLISLACLFFLASDRKKGAIMLAVFTGIFCIGYGYSYLKIQGVKSAQPPFEKGNIEATVDGISFTSGGWYKISFCDIIADGKTLNGGGVGYFSTKGSFKEGHRYRFDCSIDRRIEQGYFIYDIFCGKPYGIAHVKNTEYLYDLSTLSQKASIYIKEEMASGMSDDGYALAVALVLGDTSLMGERLDLYRLSGISHAFSVSGLHVGLFIALFALFAKLLKFKKLIRALFILIPTTFYCFVCGLRPSTVRALIMATVIIASGELGFKKDVLSSIALALIIVLCIQPFYLFDYGARLSFVAVTGIVALTPVFSRLLKPVKSIGEPIAVASSAWLSTMPILTDMSGYMSIITVFANLVIVPILSLAYQFTLISVLLGAIEYAIFGQAIVTLFLPSVILSFIGSFVELFDFSGFIIECTFGFASFFFYFGLFFVTDYLNISKKVKTIVAISAFVLTVLFMIIM